MSYRVRVRGRVRASVKVGVRNSFINFYGRFLQPEYGQGPYSGCDKVLTNRLII